MTTKTRTRYTVRVGGSLPTIRTTTDYEWTPDGHHVRRVSDGHVMGRDEYAAHAARPRNPIS